MHIVKLPRLTIVLLLVVLVAYFTAQEYQRQISNELRETQLQLTKDGDRPIPCAGLYTQACWLLIDAGMLQPPIPYGD